MKELRLNKLDQYAQGIVDIQLSHNPLAQEVMVIFNDITRNQYQDAVQVESKRVKKLALVKKNIDMNYVQEIGGNLLLEEYDSLPWVINMTITGLERLPKMDDQILIDGIKYTISMVKPANRSLQSIINVFIYPEKTSQIEKLSIISCEYLHDDIFSIIYTGRPLEMSYDGVNWIDFVSYGLLHWLDGGVSDSIFKKWVDGGCVSSISSLLIDGGNALNQSIIYVRNETEQASYNFESLYVL